MTVLSSRSPKTEARGPLVYVSVIDGDTHRKVKGAVVRIGSHADEVGRRGIATLRVRRARPLPVTAWARRYAKRKVRMAFGPHHKWVTLFLFKPASQWPLYGVTPARTQAQTNIHIRPPFRIAWSRGMGSLIEFPAVVWSGVAFIANARGVVRAVSMRSGRVAWRTDTNGPMAASPAVVGNELVAHGMDGRIYVLDRYNGRIKRRFSIGSPIESSPVVRHGIDYFGSYNGLLYCVSARTGSTLWTANAGGRISGAAVVVDGIAYAGTGKHIIGVDVHSGRVRVNFEHGEYVPVSGNGQRLLFHGYSRLYALE